MTDEPDQQLDPVSSAADDARIRELLSGARETGPMPAPVVARLDDALAGLVAQREVDEAQLTEATGYGATVHPIIRSRRHRVVAVLGAAAAVAVVGLGIGAVIDQAPDEARRRIVRRLGGRPRTFEEKAEAPGSTLGRRQLRQWHRRSGE